jgi:hypothetical protein
MTDSGVSSFVVVKEGNKILEQRQTYFPNLELGMTIDEDVSEERGHSGSLIVAKAVTRERMAEFLNLPLIWKRESFSYGACIIRLANEYDSAIETGVDISPVKRINYISLDPDADIKPYTTPHQPDRHVFLSEGARLCDFTFQRVTPGICRAIEQMFELADPAYDAKKEMFMPSITLNIRDGMEGFLGLVESVSYGDVAHLLAWH